MQCAKGHLTFRLPLMAMLFSVLYLAGCNSPEMEEMSRIRRIQNGNIPPSAEPLTMDVRTWRDDRTENNGSESRVHVVTIGNWMVSCSYQRNAGNTSPIASCDVAPFSGEILATQPVPVPTMAVAEYRRGRAPVMTLVVFAPEPETEWSYACGNRSWSGIAQGGHTRAALDERASAAFLNVMKTRDCEFSYFVAGETEPSFVHHLSHGFSEASTYAQRYITSPR